MEFSEKVQDLLSFRNILGKVYRNVERRFIQVIADIRIGAAGEEELSQIYLNIQAGMVEIEGINIRTIRDENISNLRVSFIKDISPGLAYIVKGSQTIDINCPHVRAGVD